MPNNRIYYPHVAIGIAPQGSASFTPIHGVQEFGMSTNFNLEQVQEIGQFEIYEDVEGLPEVEFNIDKVLDGYPLIYHLATQGAATDSLAGRANRRCTLACSIFDDDQDSASGTPLAELQSSGLYADSLRYTIPSEGNCTESVTLKGNHAQWVTAGFTFTGTLFDNTDQPLALSSGLGGVQRRENVIFAGATLANVTRLPHGLNGIPGISASGTNDKTAGVYGAHISNITISSDLNREDITELGTKNPYFRAPQGNTDVTCEIAVVSILGPGVSFNETGIASGNNTFNKTIQVVLEDGTKFNLGTKNRMTGVQLGGLSANGGNATDTYSFRNRNHLVISHPLSP